MQSKYISKRQNFVTGKLKEEFKGMSEITKTELIICLCILVIVILFGVLR